MHQPNVLRSEVSVDQLTFVYQIPGVIYIQIMLYTIFIHTRNKTFLRFTHYDFYVVAVMYFFVDIFSITHGHQCAMSDPEYGIDNVCAHAHDYAVSVQ